MKLVNMHDLNSCAKACGFKSRPGYYKWKIGRVVDRGALEKHCTERYRRFESYIFRHGLFVQRLGCYPVTVEMRVRFSHRPLLKTESRSRQSNIVRDYLVVMSFRTRRKTTRNLYTIKGI